MVSQVTGGSAEEKAALLHQIKQSASGEVGPPLTQTNDRSAPVIESSVVVKKSSQPALNDAISSYSGGLQETETNDRSAPVIEQSATLKKSAMPDLMAEVQGAKSDA